MGKVFDQRSSSKLAPASSLNVAHMRLGSGVLLLEELGQVRPLRRNEAFRRLGKFGLPFPIR